MQQAQLPPPLETEATHKEALSLTTTQDTTLNYRMTDAEFQIFAHLVLGLDFTNDGMGMGSEGHKQHN